MRFLLQSAESRVREPPGIAVQPVRAMRGRRRGHTGMVTHMIARALVAVLALGIAAAGARAQTRQPDSFTPLVIGPLATDTAPFLGDDGQFHLVYELWVTNAKAVP